MKDTLVDEGKSPLQNVFEDELRERVETELRAWPNRIAPP